jgi:hypothetical protein
MINLDAAQPRASVAWFSPSAAGPSARIVSAAETAGFEILDASLTESKGDRSDIAVLDLRGAEQSKPIVTDLLARARALAPLCGVIILASSETDRAQRSWLRRHADICYVRKDTSPVVAAIRERLRLAGLVDEMGERIKSLIADGRTCSFTGLGDETTGLSVLIAGRPSPATLSACNAVRQTASQTTCVFTAGQVMRALDHCQFDSAIFLPEDENDLLLALARALRRHRDHRRLPVILAAQNEDLLDRCAARDGFESILAGHLDSDLASRIDLYARRARMASSIRLFLRSPAGCAGGSDGAAGARFFAHHAIRVFRRADEMRQPVSLVGLSLTPRLEGAPTDAISRALNDALRTAARLVRAEDMIAKLTPTTLILLIRNVRARDSLRIAERLDGVISGTLGRATLDIAQISAAAIERDPGDSIETAIAALVRQLRVHKNAGRAAR